MKMRPLLFAVLMVASGSASAADKFNPLSPAELRLALKDYEAILDGRMQGMNMESILHAHEALGYVVGIADTMDLNKMVCLPDQATHAQMAALALKYIDEHPNKWQYDAGLLVGASLIDAFPCKKR